MIQEELKWWGARQVIKGVFTPIVRWLWFTLVDELVNSERFPLGSVIIWAIYKAKLYQQNAKCTSRKRLENTILLHTCGLHLVVGLDRSRITFPPQTNRSRVCLGPNRHHLFLRVLVRLFWSSLECDYCVHTCPDELHKGRKPTRIWFNRTKKHKCENTTSSGVWRTWATLDRFLTERLFHYEISTHEQQWLIRHI